MKKKICIIMIILILIMILFANISIVQGAQLSNSITAAQNFTNNGKSSIVNYQNLYNTVNFLYNVVMIIAIIIAVIVGIILGMRIIFGSIDERADSKHLLVPYLVIVMMVAFGLTIWKIVIGLIYDKI